jgi:predicted ribonuclease YlaK
MIVTTSYILLKRNDLMSKKLNKNHMFFGLDLTDEQKLFRDAIYEDDYNIIFCNASSGTGKTTIAIAVAKLLVSEGRYNGLKYVFSPVEESRLGYSSGTIEEKESKYLLPLHDALMTINELPEKCIASSVVNISKKSCTTWIEAVSHTFLRGSNISQKIVVLDELQNWTVPEIKKVLTRCHDNCKIICIGHCKQIDLKNKNHSGFEKYIKHFESQSKCKVCKLTRNFRGQIATHADLLEE